MLRACDCSEAQSPIWGVMGYHAHAFSRSKKADLPHEIYLYGSKTPTRKNTEARYPQRWHYPTYWQIDHMDSRCEMEFRDAIAPVASSWSSSLETLSRIRPVASRVHRTAHRTAAQAETGV